MIEPPRRHFTREEADALLPEVDQLLSEAQALAEQLAEAQVEDMGNVRRNGHAPHVNGTADAGSGEALIDKVAELVGRVQQLGVVVRDVRTGLVDFPSLRAGEEIYLCWRRGEPFEIHWWHRTDAGFSSRQPLD